ncbi:MAG TPA: chaperone modulator CbpM [Kofleriaceae bacterium]
MTRFTYQRLVELVGGDDELIARCVDEGIIEKRTDDDRVTVDVDRVLVARTLVRDLEVGWTGVELVLRLCDELAEARERIAALEHELAKRRS